jgi:hypothetical protein
MFEAMSSSNRQLTSVKPCLFDQRANGLLLCVGFLAAIILIGLGSAAVWGAIVGAALNQRLVGTFGGSLCISSGHSSSISSRISSEASERRSVSSRNLCNRSKSSCTMI